MQTGHSHHGLARRRIGFGTCVACALCVTLTGGAHARELGAHHRHRHSPHFVRHPTPPAYKPVVPSNSVSTGVESSAVESSLCVGYTIHPHSPSALGVVRWRVLPARSVPPPSGGRSTACRAGNALARELAPLHPPRRARPFRVGSS